MDIGHQSHRNGACCGHPLYLPSSEHYWSWSRNLSLAFCQVRTLSWYSIWHPCDKMQRALVWEFQQAPFPLHCCVHSCLNSANIVEDLWSVSRWLVCCKCRLEYFNPTLILIATWVTETLTVLVISPALSFSDRFYRRRAWKVLCRNKRAGQLWGARVLLACVE